MVRVNHTDPILDNSLPYFVHPGDGPTSAVVQPLLTGSNFQSWFRSMKRALGAKMKLEFVDGTLPMPEDDFDPAYRAWHRCNQLVSSWILNSVSSSIAQSVVFMENTIDIWNDLRERFSQGDLIRISELQQEIYAMKQGTRSVTDFYSDLKILWEELELYMPIPSCTCRQHCTCEAMRSARRNHLLLHTIRFLTGLNENFATVKSQILLMDPVPPMNKVFSMVIQYERHGKFAEFDDTKLLINAAKTSKSSSGSHSSSSNSIVRHCTFCGKDNHFVENCFKKNGVPPHMKKFSSANHAATAGGSNDPVPAINPSISQEQYDQLMILLQNSQLVQGSASASSNQVGSSMNSGHSPDSHKGASHHICNSLNWFQSYIEITPIKIQLPNGNFAIAKFSGVEKRYLRMIGSASEHEGLYHL
ncbi:hypothetical protein A2U01_0008442, partial [Trifolium medium]|nr:hypothetical protein [Trifolium medium]